MRRMMCLLAVWLSFGAANASDVSEAEEFCALPMRLAELTMQLRQNGNSLKSMLDTVGDDGLKRHITIGAFDYPLCDDEACRDRSTLEFGSQIYLECMKAQK